MAEEAAPKNAIPQKPKGDSPWLTCCACSCFSCIGCLSAVAFVIGVALSAILHPFGSSISGLIGGICNVKCVVNNHEVPDTECKWLNYIAHEVMPHLEGSRDQQLDVAATVAWWSLKEGVMSMKNPIAYSNCNYSSGDKYVGPLEVCPSGRAWQVGLAAAQVPGKSLEDLEATATQLFPEQTSSDVLAQTARDAGLSDSDVDKVANSTGDLRRSWLLRVSAIGFTYEYDPIIAECIKGSRSWCYGGRWGSSRLYAPNREGAMKAIADIRTLLDSASSGSSTDCIEGGAVTDPTILQDIVNKMKQSGAVTGIVGHWSDDYLVKLQVPYWNGSAISTMTIATNKAVAGSVAQIFQELADIHFRIIPGETHSWRTAQGAGPTHTPSAHLFGFAIDINPSVNPYCTNCARPIGSNDRGTITDEVIAIFARHGFQWGGNWNSVKDYMHFTANQGNISGMLQ